MSMLCMRDFNLMLIGDDRLHEIPIQKVEIRHFADFLLIHT